MTKRLTRFSSPAPPLVTRQGIALSESEKADALADSLEAQFRRVNDPSDSALVKMLDEAM
jgi:archaellum component FlaG (FlaF/FlaG flagellin family)